MKKAKLLFPLLALLCICIPLGACKKNESGKNPELEEHFAISEETKSYSSVDRIEGEVIAVDTDNNYIAVKTTKVDKLNYIIETVKIIDMKTLQVIHEQDVTNPSTGPVENRTTLQVEFNYPCFTIIQRYRSFDGVNYYFNYSYYHYLLKLDNTYPYSTEINAVSLGSSNSGLNSVQKGSLYMVETSESTLWINERFEIIREFKKGQLDGYTSPRIQMGYENYLYAWDNGQSNSIQVYNAEGVVCMQYTYPSSVNAILSGPFVLNNGNILVQEATLLDVTATDYTFKYMTPDGDMKFDLQTKVVDYKTGEATVIDCDYLIVDLMPAYAGKGDFPFALASGQENQAYVSKIVNRYVSSVEYVVLDNQASIVYSFPNEMLANSSNASSYSNIEVLNDKYYGAMVYEDGNYKACLFDMFGNLVLELPEMVLNGDSNCGVCNDFYVTPYGIYDFEQNILFDLEDYELLYNKDASKDVRLFVKDNGAFIEETDKVTKVITLYQFNPESKDFEVIGDSNKEMRLFSSLSLPMGNYVTVLNKEDNGARSYTWTLYNSDGEAFVRVQVDNIYNVLQKCDGLAFIETEINGNPYVYIIK